MYPHSDTDLQCRLLLQNRYWLGGNIVSIHHDRYDLNIDITSCILDIRVETRDQAHIDEIVSALLANGIRITNL